MPSRTLAVVAFVLLALPAGCGVRTPLSVGMDGSTPGPGRDAGVRDTGPPRDSGPPPRCTGDFECDDGQLCNGLERCAGGRCQPGMPLFCEDGIECTEDRCVEETDSCASIPRDERCGPGGICDPFAGCSGRSCVGDAECDDGRGCNGREICSPDGVCIGGIDAPRCADSFDCTIDVCDEPGICTHLPDDSRCFPPGSRCDLMIGCTGGGCMSDFDCNDGRICNGEERCRGGACMPGTPIACNDGVACTRDECTDVVGGCTSTPDNTLCPAGQLCNVMVGCERRGCRGDFDCDDGSFCNGFERCDAASGSCRAGIPPSCDDFQACTIDRCIDAFGGCFSEPRSFREICGNAIDDDCDFLVDCGDADCSGAPGCPTCVPEADFEFACSDGRDQDCDLRVDCDDPDCFGTFECCVPRSMVEFDCFDGTDDDCDFSFDCADPDCFRVCTPPEDCGNRFDDDRDGFVDCADFDCRFDFRCSRDAGPPPRDSGPIRDAGPPRDSGPVTGELGVAACTNGRDDDGDGRTDCSDTDCRPFGAMGECCNDRDDDGDGTTDIFTCRCFDDALCAGVGDLDQVCWESEYAVCVPRCNLYGGDSFCRMWFPGMFPRCNRMTGECIP